MPSGPGGDEELLGGDVRVVHDAVHRAALRAAEEERLGDEADAQVRAVGGAVLERDEAHGVERLGAGLELQVVLTPVLLRVALERAGAGENGLPELFNGPALGQVGKDLLGPLDARHGGDAPLLAVLARVDVGAELLVAGLHTLGVLGLVYTRQAVRVLAEDDDAGREVFGLPLLLFLLPGLDLAELFGGLVSNGEAGQGLVPPLDLDLRGPGSVALGGEQLDELWLVQTGDDEHALALLHVRAGTRYEPRILLQNRLFHIFPHLI